MAMTPSTFRHMTPPDAKARAERAVHDVWFAAMCLKVYDPEDIGASERDDLQHAVDVLQRVIDGVKVTA